MVMLGAETAITNAGFGMDAILDVFVGPIISIMTAGGQKGAHNVVLDLLKILMTAELTFFGMYMALVKSGSLANVIEKILQMVFIYFVLTNFVLFSAYLRDGLAAMVGSLFNGTLFFGNIFDLKTTDGKSLASLDFMQLSKALTPDGIMQFSFTQVTYPLQQWSIAVNANSITDGWGLLSLGILAISDMITSAVQGFVIQVSFLVMSLQVLLAYIEYYVVLFMAYIVFPFTVFEGMRFVGERALAAVYGQIVKITILMIVTCLVVAALQKVMPKDMIMDMVNFANHSSSTYSSYGQIIAHYYAPFGAVPSAEVAKFSMGFIKTQMVFIAVAAMLIHLFAPVMAAAFLGSMPNLSLGNVAQTIGSMIHAAKDIKGLMGKGGGGAAAKAAAAPKGNPKGDLPKNNVPATIPRSTGGDGSLHGEVQDVPSGTGTGTPALSAPRNDLSHLQEMKGISGGSRKSLAGPPQRQISGTVTRALPPPSPKKENRP